MSSLICDICECQFFSNNKELKSTGWICQDCYHMDVTCINCNKDYELDAGSNEFCNDCLENEIQSNEYPIYLKKLIVSKIN